MIDTDKYEGHSEGHKEGSWNIYEVYGSDNKLMKCIRPLHDKWGVDLPLVASKDAQLIADAPLILAEYKKLRQFARLSNYSFSESLPELMQALVDERAEVKRLREWENRIRTYFGDEEMMDFYDWMKEKYGDDEE